MVFAVDNRLKDVYFGLKNDTRSSTTRTWSKASSDARRPAAVAVAVAAASWLPQNVCGWFMIDFLLICSGFVVGLLWDLWWFMWIYVDLLLIWGAIHQPLLPHFRSAVACTFGGWRRSVRRKVLGCSTWSSPHQRPQGLHGSRHWIWGMSGDVDVDVEVEATQSLVWSI